MFHPDPRLVNTVFVVFSDDWGRHPSSCQHLFRRVVPHAQVIWVNTVGLRTPKLGLYDLKRAWQVAASWLLPSPRRVSVGSDDPSPRVIGPMMWPSFGRAWNAALNQWLLIRAVRRAVASVAPDKNVILVSTLPIIPGLFRQKFFRRTVYYCVDDFTQWHGIDGKAMLKLETETLARCDALVAASSPILESRGKHLERTLLLTHGVDVAHFASGRAPAGGPMSRFRPPILGLFGVFDQRVDGDLLRDLSRAFPEGSLVTIGPVDRDISVFADLRNLFFVGKVPYQELPDYVAAFDVCILPYVTDETTRHINPLKLREYLATGKPVVATPLPEVEKLKDYLSVADRRRFPAAVVEVLLNPPVLPAGLDAFLIGESWDRKAEQFLDFVLEGM